MTKDNARNPGKAGKSKAAARVKEKRVLKATLRPMDAIALAISQEKTINTDLLYKNTTAKFGHVNARDMPMTTEQGAKLALVSARILKHKGTLTATDKRNLEHIAEFGIRSFFENLTAGALP